MNDKEYLKLFGKHIRQLRLEHGMTQEEFAKVCGYKNRSSVCRVENGEQDMPTPIIENLCNALHVTVDDVLLMTAERQRNQLMMMYDTLDEHDQEIVYELVRNMYRANLKKGKHL